MVAIRTRGRASVAVDLRWWRWLVALVLRHALARALLFLLVVIIDPFGSVSWTEQRSHEIWERLNAPRYGSNQRAAAARDAITVVTIAEADQAQMAQPGLLDSIHYREMLHVLREGPSDPVAPRHAPPAAIFIDLLMDDWAPADKQTVDEFLARDKAWADCPKVVPVGGRYRSPPGLSPFRCLLREIAEMNGYEQWKSVGSCTQSELAKLDCILDPKYREPDGRVRTPILIASTNDPSDTKAGFESPAALALRTVAVSVPVLSDRRYYPLVAPQPDDAPSGPYLYPAAMLYAAYCRSAGATCGKSPILAPDEAAARSNFKDSLGRWHWSEAFRTPLDVTWGIGKDDKFVDAAKSIGSRENCTEAVDNVWHLITAGWREFVSGVWPRENPPPCFYQHRIPYGVLRWGRSAFSDQSALWNYMLQNKIVLIGGNSRNGNDMVSTGPHMQVPGVFYHAMALDNLIRRGADYARKPTQIVGNMTDADVANAAAVGIMALFGGIAVGLRQIRAHQPPSGRARVPFWRLALSMLIWVAAATAWMLGCAYVIVPGPPFSFYEFNLAGLSIVILVEWLSIVSVVCEPILQRLCETSAFLRFFFGEVPVLPARG